MRPELIACCRTSDPDPACLSDIDHVLGLCARCEEEIRISLTSLPYVIAGVPTWCIQCAVTVPGLMFAR